MSQTIKRSGRGVRRAAAARGTAQRVSKAQGAHRLAASTC